MSVRERVASNVGVSVPLVEVSEPVDVVVCVSDTDCVRVPVIGFVVLTLCVSERVDDRLAVWVAASERVFVKV